MSEYRIHWLVRRVRPLTRPTAAANKRADGARQLNHIPGPRGEERRVCLGQQWEGAGEENRLIAKRHQRRIRSLEERADCLGVLQRRVRTHMQDATPLTLGQEWSGYAGMLSDDLER